VAVMCWKWPEVKQQNYDHWSGMEFLS